MTVLFHAKVSSHLINKILSSYKIINFFSFSFLGDLFFRLLLVFQQNSILQRDLDTFNFGQEFFRYPEFFLIAFSPSEGWTSLCNDDHGFRLRRIYFRMRKDRNDTNKEWWCYFVFGLQLRLLLLYNFESNNNSWNTSAFRYLMTFRIFEIS